MSSSRIGNPAGAVTGSPSSDVAAVVPGDAASATPADVAPGAGAGTGSTAGGWDAGWIAANTALQSTLSNHEAFKSLISSSSSQNEFKKRDERLKEMAQAAAELKASEFKTSEQKATVKTGMLKASFLNSATLQRSASANASSSQEASPKDGAKGENAQAKGGTKNPTIQSKKQVAERTGRQTLSAHLQGETLEGGDHLPGEHAALPQRGKSTEQPKSKQKQTEKQAQKEKFEQMARAKAKADHAKKEAGEGADNASKFAAEEDSPQSQTDEAVTQENAFGAELQGQGAEQGALAQATQNAAKPNNVNAQKMNGQVAVEEYGIGEESFSDIAEYEEEIAELADGGEGAGVGSTAGTDAFGGEPQVAALGRTKDQHQRLGDETLDAFDDVSEDGDDLFDNPLMMRRQARGGDDKEIVDFLAAAGVDPNEPPAQQKEKVMRALKSLSPEESERILGQLETHFGDNVARAQVAAGEPAAKPAVVSRSSGRVGGNDRLANLEQQFAQNLEKQDRLANLLEKYIAADASAKVAQAESQERLIGVVIKNNPNYKLTYHDNPLSSQWTRSGSSGISLYEGRHSDMLARQQGFQDVAGGVDHLSTPQTLNQKEAVANALAYEPRVTHADGANDYRTTTRIVGELNELADLTNLTVKLNTPRSV